MTDIRRTVLWVVFTMSLVLLWDGWQKHNGQPSMFSPPAPKPAAVAGSAPGTGLPTASALPGSTGVAGTAAPAAAATTGEAIHIKTDVLDVTLNTLGGDVTRVELPHYLTGPEPGLFDPILQAVGIKEKKAIPQTPVRVLDSAGHSYKAQTGLLGGGAAGSLPDHNTLMQVTSAERELKAGQNELSVRLESPEQGGVKYIKTFTFKRGDYVIGVKHEIVNVGTTALTPQVYVQLVRDGVATPGGTAFTGTFTGPALYTEKAKFQKVEFADIEKDKADIDKTADNGWVAMVQHYFASAWLHTDAAQREFFASKVPNMPQQYRVGMVFTLPSVAPGTTATKLDQLFVGPQEENKLAALAPGLELVKDYGIFAILAKPLFWLLEKLHAILGNWGWAIIALVVLLKIAFYWLNASAYKSMAKMKAVGPKVQAMRERLKDKPQEMQQEMMRIYREEKVNPIGGCLPIFLQMPFFMGLYWVLLSTVEMRGAPWLGWITDLSAKDPYFILPLLMTASSLFQVWLNPTPPDPMQAKMMWIMPLAFSFMFFVFPSGLVLYWLVNNILSIAQQWFINKQLGVQN